MTIVQATYCATMVDEWVRCGVTNAVICPGSRSTPMAMALSAHKGIRVHIQLDERSATFVALGMGAATGIPAVLCVTSGTAVAECHAGVVEADLGSVPLIVVSADRPPVLHQVGAPQTIDQNHLFSRSVRFFAEPGIVRAEERTTWRSLAARLVYEATAGPHGPGPVHLNQAFIEPLLGEVGELPPSRLGDSPWHQYHVAQSRSASFDLPDMSGKKGVLVVGAGAGTVTKIIALSEKLGWPLLGDPRSRARVAHPNVIAHADLLARAQQSETLIPEVVLQLGSGWISKPLNALLQKAATRIVVQPFGDIEDPEHSVDHFVHSECDLFVDALFSLTLSPPSKEWLTAWVEKEKKAREIVADFLGLGEKGDHPLSEPALAASLFEWVDDDVTVVVSSSMPIRDVEWFAPPRSVAPRIISNRGANGIDGVVSTALGVALGTRKATVCLVGDLAFLHDVSALVKMRSSDLVAPLVIVVANNAGGGIFEFLPPSQQLERERFELLFGTPPSVDIAAVANGFGHRVREVATRGEFKEALNWGLSTPCLSVVVVQLPTREKNRQLHDELTKRFNAAF